ncbi:MAG TPA: TIGR03435 family protein [Bryobacteraceae bacterium]|nr:TIGR03435 family protein [Bryobacteraceae bacterium]
MPFALLAASAVFCQQPAPRSEFEVASVKPSPPVQEGNLNVGVHIDGAMVRCNFLTLINYLDMAYDVKDYQIIGPDWLVTEHFDIVGKRPEGVEGEKALRGMVASLLEDRFKMVMHRETRELPAYALVVGKGGLKIKEVPPDADGGDNSKVDVNVTGGGRGGTVVDLGGGSSISYGLNKLEAHKVSFALVVDSLAKFLDRPVVDETGLAGRYNFTLEYSVDELRNLVRASGADASRIPDFGGDQVSIFTSVESIGLKLEPRKTSVPVIVIDSIQKTPTAN